MTAKRGRGGRRARRSRLALLSLVLALVLLAPQAALAAAAAGAPRVPVLIVDGGLGDSEVWIAQWLGAGATAEAKPGSTLRLWRAKTPAWLGATTPPTYLLASTSETGGAVPGAIGAADIAWALDRVTAGADASKAMLVAHGVAGLQARSYLQGQAGPKYAGRADVVGLVLLGTPEQGLEMAERYPRLDVWDAMGAAAGLNRGDLLPGNPWLTKLNGATLPSAVRTGVVRGLPSRVGGFESDGLVTRADSVVPTAVVFDEVAYAETRSRASDVWSITGSWSVLTPRGGATTDTVEERLVEQIGFARGYAVDPDVRSAVGRMYSSWFGDRMPTTHISTRLVLDVSGSMAAKWSGTTKLDGARTAAMDFGNALKARTALPGATPEDIGLVMFATTPQLTMRPTADPAPMAGLLKAVSAKSNTDVGAALAMAVDSFSLTPRAADKVIVLLSDGLPTSGMDKAGVLNGPVAKAKAAGIRVSTIALGDVGDVDSEFLGQVAKATGGSFHKSNDLFELRRDFLRARFASLGPLLVDREVRGPQRVEIATATATTRRVESAIVPGGGALDVKVLRGGQVVAPAEYDVRKAEGVTLVSIRRPKPGAYAIEISGDAKGRSHVFSVADADLFVDTGMRAARDDSPMLLLMLIGGGLLVAVAATVFLSTRPKAERREPVGESQ